MSGILAYALHYEGAFNKNSLGGVSEAARLASELGCDAHAVVIGDVSDDLAASLGNYGVTKVFRAKDAPEGLAQPVVDVMEKVMDDGGRAVAGLLGLERVEAADDHAHAGAVMHVGDLRVLQDRALGDELAVLDADARDLHADAGVQARRQARADLEAEQAAAEQRVAMAVVRDDLGHRVDDRLREALGPLDAEDLRRAVAAERGAELVGQAGLVADHHGVALAAELARQARALGYGAQGVLVERALVVQRVDQDPAHRTTRSLGFPDGTLMRGASFRQARRRSSRPSRWCPRPR